VTLRNQLFEFIKNNNYIDKKCQKGFRPGAEGAAEHSQLLTHIMVDTKRHQRSLIITLIDFRNAIGEVHHNLIRRALIFHHVPQHIIDIIGDIFTDTTVQISHSAVMTTPLIYVQRGVLQGDPCFPLIFDLCFNTLMVTISANNVLWGPNHSLHPSSCLQFAHDSLFISNSIAGAQAVLDVNTAWCNWADVTIRIDKC